MTHDNENKFESRTEQGVAGVTGMLVRD